MKKSVVILYFHLLPFFFFAQSVQLESITVADGLSQGFISTILQTEDGFLWIGTLDGLNRYDGHNFKIYTHNPFDPWSLSGDYITELFEDSKGRLWVGTNESGINMLDRRSNRFFHLEYQMENKQRLSLQEIQGVIEDPRGAIWIAPNDNYVIKLTLPKDFPSAFRFSNDSIPKVGIKSFKLTTPDVASKKLNTSHCFNLLTDSTIHMGTEHGLYQVDLQTNRFESVDIPNIPGRSEQGVLDIYKDNSGALWLARPGFLTRIYDGEFRNYAGFGFANVLQSDRNDGHLWISREEQLYRVEPSDLNKKSTSHWPTFYNSPYVIRTMFEDSGGLIWLGTTGVGLRKFDSRKHKFQHYLQDQSIYSMMEDDAGQLWLRYDRIDYQKVNFENNLTSKTGFFGNRFAYVFDIILDSSGIFWAWVEEKKNENLFIIKYSKKNGTLQKYAIPLEMRHDFSAKLLEDAHGQIWGAGPAGFLARYDEAADTLIFIKNDTIARRLGENSWVMHFIEDVDGHFWLGTTNGLVKVVPEHIRSGHEPVFQLYQSDPKNKRSPSHYLISTLLDDPVEPHKYLWLGTKGGGLNKMDKHSGEFTHFGLEDGLPNMVVYGILADNQKNLWISTNQGLSQFNPTTGTFKNFSEKNGLQSMEFNTFSYLKLSDGRMAFGGVNGLNVFDPEALSFNAHVPNVVIVGLKVNNKSIEFKPNPSMETDQKKERRILNRAIEQCEFVELSYNQNFLTLEFAAIDFSNPGKNEYRYQLTQSSSFLGGLFQKELDLDSDWIDAGTNHFATFTHLSSGDYLFQVKGSNNEGVWNETPTILRILIHPPWWRSNLAYLMYALTILGTLLAGYRFQINRIKLKNELAFEHKEAERLATLDRLKTDFFPTSLTNSAPR